MHISEKTNLCPLAAYQLSSEISGFSVVLSEETGHYDALAQLDTTVHLQARRNPIALLLKKPAGLDTEWSRSVSRTISSSEINSGTGSPAAPERKVVAEAMFKLLYENCLQCPLRNICPSRDSLGEDARRIADPSQQL